jgi:hypothetical protein
MEKFAEHRQRSANADPASSGLPAASTTCPIQSIANTSLSSKDRRGRPATEVMGRRETAIETRGVRSESGRMGHPVCKRPGATLRCHVEPVRLRSGQAPRSGVETSACEQRTPLVRGRISPVRPPASGRNDKEARANHNPPPYPGRTRRELRAVSQLTRREVPGILTLRGWTQTRAMAGPEQAWCHGGATEEVGT